MPVMDIGLSVSVKGQENVTAGASAAIVQLGSFKCKKMFLPVHAML
jgi:hypothetical protein